MLLLSEHKILIKKNEFIPKKRWLFDQLGTKVFASPVKMVFHRSL